MSGTKTASGVAACATFQIESWRGSPSILHCLANHELAVLKPELARNANTEAAPHRAEGVQMAFGRGLRLEGGTVPRRVWRPDRVGESRPHPMRANEGFIAAPVLIAFAAQLFPVVRSTANFARQLAQNALRGLKVTEPPWLQLSPHSDGRRPGRCKSFFAVQPTNRPLLVCCCLPRVQPGQGKEKGTSKPS